MLNIIKDNAGARKKYKALGRGIGSGKGKTSARGGKGQTARTGVALNGFEGGQTPLYMRMPKRGFKNIHRVEYSVLNLSDISRIVDSGLLKSNELSIDNLKQIGALKGHDSLLKILGSGSCTHKVVIEAHAVSSSAKSALESNGSEVKLLA